FLLAGCASSTHDHPAPVRPLGGKGSIAIAGAQSAPPGGTGAAGAPARDASIWAELAKASWIAEGSVKPTRIVYVFTDTECPYCHQLWQAIQPLLIGGDVQVRQIVLAVIAPASRGRAAAILDAASPARALSQHEGSFGHSPIKPESTVSAATARRLAANIDLAERLGIHGLPVTVVRDSAGKILQLPGLLPSSRLKAIFGS
ncbi:MAG: thiol:disulfide interchange protein DsbG, partial [Rhodanobacter sp.]|nr:thiol:disulfide interchange protein DsbG [Rhodanobacter sp.]